MSELTKVREISVFSTKTNQLTPIETAVQTWGELKDSFGGEVDFKNMRGVVQDTQVTLDLDDAKLPSEEATIFLFPKKISSGGYTPEELKKLSYKQVRGIAVEKGVGSQGTKTEMISRILGSMKANAKKTTPIVEVEEVKEDVHESLVPANQQKQNLALSGLGNTVLESVRATASLRVIVDDPSSLGEVIKLLFPGMDIVDFKAVVDIDATLAFGGTIPTVPVEHKPKVEPKAKAPVNDGLDVEVKSPKKKTDRKEVKLKDLKAQADAMKQKMNF